MSNVTFFSTNCPRCKVLKSKLDAKNIKYTIVSDKDEMIKRGFESAPMLDVDGEIMTYTKAVAWLKEM